MRENILSIYLIALVLSAVFAGYADALIQDPGDQGTKPPQAIPLANNPIKIDGIVNDEEWGDAAVFDVNNEIQPGENIPAPVNTKCYITYDHSNLYIAFICFDDNPAAIRAHYSDRDDGFDNDFIGIILDTYNDERHAYQFFVNPFGIQMDGIRNEVGGPEEDYAWDAIWDTAGRLTAEGYEVEVAIPFNQLSFKRSEKPQIWGIVALRNYPRSQRHQIANMKFDRGRNCLLCQFPKFSGFQGVEPGRNLEFNPTVTGIRTDEREDFPDGEMAERDSNADVGLSARWGITSNLTLNAAINPDFSNVEADAAQLDINTQFALYYPEKRPFFLEDFDLFEAPGQVVYTRSVADPSFGVKLTGKVGENAVGFFVARDEITNLIFPGPEDSSATSLDMRTTDNVFRLRRDIGNTSAIGVMLTDREGEEYYNRTLNVDGIYRFSENDSVTFHAAGTLTRYPDFIARDFDQESGSFGGHGVYGQYSRSTRNWGANVSYLGISDGFRADLGFMPQVGFHQVGAELERTFWGKKDDWYTQVWFEANFDEIRTRDNDVLEREFEIDGGFSSALQSNFWFNVGRRKMGYHSELFDHNFYYGGFNFKPSGDIEAGFRAHLGGWVDFDNIRPADRVRLVPFIDHSFGRHLLTSLSHTFYRLSVEGGRLFLANLSEFKVVYQFNARMFLRAIFQYEDLRLNEELYTFEVDPKQRELFTQILFSYKLNPRTVLFLGYSDNYFGSDGIDLTQTSRTFFAKLGYAWIL